MRSEEGPFLFWTDMKVVRLKSLLICSLPKDITDFDLRRLFLFFRCQNLYPHVDTLGEEDYVVTHSPFGFLRSKRYPPLTTPLSTLYVGHKIEKVPVVSLNNDRPDRTSRLPWIIWDVRTLNDSCFFFIGNDEVSWTLWRRLFLDSCVIEYSRTFLFGHFLWRHQPVSVRVWTLLHRGLLSTL